MATKKAGVLRAQQRAVRFTRPADYPTAYANNAQVTMSNWDFRIDFGEVVSADDKEIVIQQRIGVVMSPQHTKALAQVLTKNVEEYEKSFGELKWGQESE